MKIAYTTNHPVFETLSLAVTYHYGRQGNSKFHRDLPGVWMYDLCCDGNGIEPTPHPEFKVTDTSSLDGVVYHQIEIKGLLYWTDMEPMVEPYNFDPSQIETDSSFKSIEWLCDESTARLYHRCKILFKEYRRLATDEKSVSGFTLTITRTALSHHREGKLTKDEFIQIVDDAIHW